MPTLILILKLLYFVDCLFLIGVVLLQKGNAQGISGAIGGAGETYWGKNKARSMEGGLHKTTVAAAIMFIVISLLLNILK